MSVCEGLIATTVFYKHLLIDIVLHVFLAPPTCVSNG